MNNYPENEYPNLYNEIVKDLNHRCGKFNAINYPIVPPGGVTPKDTNPTPLLPKPIRKLPK